MKKITIIDIFNLIIAVLALSFTFYQFNDSNKENIIIFKNDIVKDDRYLEIVKNDSLYYLTSILELTVSNNSKHPISIIKYKISNIYNDKLINISNIDSLDILERENHRKIVPLNLNIYESKNIFIPIQIYLNKAVLNVLSNEKIVDTSCSCIHLTNYTNIESALNKNNIDIFGNFKEIKKIENKQIVYIEFILSNGNQIYSTITL